MGLNKPLSVRLTDEDSIFLAGLELEDATTASDKVRALIRLARQRGQTPEDYGTALSISRDMLAGPLRALRLAEARDDRHSAVLVGLTSAVEDFLALALLTPHAAEGGPAEMTRHEARMVERAARLTEMMLRWAVTAQTQAYDTRAVAERLAPLAELMTLVAGARATEEEA